ARAPEGGQLLRAAAGGALALQEVGRLLEHAGVVRRVVLQARPVEAIAAARLEAPRFAIEAQPLGVDGRLVALHLDATARAELEIADALERLRVDRRLAGEIGEQLLRKRRRGGG